ncbi:outer membrane lipoprotein-sorting protein [Pleionea litopenaei]|uniref:Outer membrane lipoprotein-sorting protein n=1 Tax=Pleionea litopenaei TaxID=3070815 RepID=A0AA51X736_9GAMM|nr:outer membrane lipoprotein-sorting protein [Pleionea sp. HL-JVS1]WMS87922.1 outer membrane lipoprotein-sorting protein [Pleionea sp. HL-JVS1]
MNQFSKWLKLTSVITLLAGSISGFSESLTADAIVEKANLASYYAGKDGRSDARMKIVDAQGRTQLRQFVILRQDVIDGDDQNFLVVFSRPSDVSGTSFLVNKHPKADDDRWLYLPGLDLVKRISAGDKRTSFVGSHYYYEDVSGRPPSEDIHELTGQDDKFYQLKHRPKNPESVEFKYYTTKIDKETFLPMEIKYFDSSDHLIRSVEVQKVEVIQGFPTVIESKITDHKLNGYTLMQFAFMKYDLGVPESVFSERSLRNPPAQWLKRQ